MKLRPPLERHAPAPDFLGAALVVLGITVALAVLVWGSPLLGGP